MPVMIYGGIEQGMIINLTFILLITYFAAQDVTSSALSRMISFMMILVSMSDKLGWLYYWSVPILTPIPELLTGQGIEGHQTRESNLKWPVVVVALYWLLRVTGRRCNLRCISPNLFTFLTSQYPLIFRPDLDNHEQLCNDIPPPSTEGSQVLYVTLNSKFIF